MDEKNFLHAAGAAFGETVRYDELIAFGNWAKVHAQPYNDLMTFYRCAIMEVETKFKVLSADLSLHSERNLIESIQTRLKKPESVMNKVLRKNIPLSIESIEKNIQDIAGIRIICPFVSDIYTLADTFLHQDDVVLIQKKDYIQNPKPNGYRSLHLIVSVPIFLHNEKKAMNVEVQMRTLAMDLWASTEHMIRYKKTTSLTEEDNRELLDCARICATLDDRLEDIYHRANVVTDDGTNPNAEPDAMSEDA